MTDQSAADPITERLVAEIKARAGRGFQKYGVTLDAAKLTPAEILQHAKEEALDLAAYLEKLIGMKANDALFPLREIESDRIAAAPRAWVVKTPAGKIITNSTENSAEAALHSFVSQFRRDREEMDGYTAIPIALVPLTEKEAQQ